MSAAHIAALQHLSSEARCSMSRVESLGFGIGVSARQHVHVRACIQPATVYVPSNPPYALSLQGYVFSLQPYLPSLQPYLPSLQPYLPKLRPFVPGDDALPLCHLRLGG